MADLQNHHHTPSLSYDIDSDPEIAAIRNGLDGDFSVKSGGTSAITSSSTGSKRRIPSTFHDIDSDDELAAVKAGDLPIHTGGISMGTFVPSLPHIETHDIDSDDELLPMRDSGLTRTGGRKSVGARMTGGPSARYKQEPDIDSEDELAATTKESKDGNTLNSENYTGNMSRLAKRDNNSTGPKELKSKMKPPITPKAASSSSARILSSGDEGPRARHGKRGPDAGAQQSGPTTQRSSVARPENETKDDLPAEFWTLPVPVAIGLMMCTPFMMMLLALWWNNSSKKG